MNILSLEFLTFFLGLLIVYYSVPRRWRWIVLLLASMLFYAFAGWRSLVYLICVAIITFFGALGEAKLHSRLSEFNSKADDDKAALPKKRVLRQKRWLLAIVLLVCFGFMVFFKIFDALILSSKTYFASIESAGRLLDITFFVPLGLSYFTFQSVGYVMDIYWGKYKPERNPLKYLLFVSFFPQMTQGPISNWPQLAPQLALPQRFEPETFVSGGQLLLWGYFKKLVIADRLAPIVASVSSQANILSGWLAVFCALAFAIRLYADFSGGMDIVRGIASMLGINLIQNFKRPFFAKTVAEYWRRWHISLGTWFRTYLYFPFVFSRFSTALGIRAQNILGKKTGYALPSALATLIVFLFIGLWHIAYWNAVFYGLYFGSLLGLSILVEPLFRKMRTYLHMTDDSVFWKAVKYLRTWILIIFAQYFAIVQSPSETFSLFKTTITDLGIKSLIAAWGHIWAMQEPLEWGILAAAMLLLLLVDIINECGYDLNTRLTRAPIYLRWPLVITLILMILIFGSYGEGFANTAFLYTQF